MDSRNKVSMQVTIFNPGFLQKKLPDLALNNVYIGGGAIRDCLIGEKPSDIDVFGETNALKQFEKDNFGDQQPDFSNGVVNNFNFGGQKVQVCYRNLMKPEDFIRHVDFSIC
jgi:hypothetical protein